MTGSDYARLRGIFYLGGIIAGYAYVLAYAVGWGWSRGSR